MTTWGDAKRFLFWQFVVYGFCLAFLLVLDPINNLLFAIGLSNAFHPYSFGVLQLGGLVFFSALILVTKENWKYYS